MITVIKEKEVKGQKAILYQIVCLDTDIKPIYNNMANGSALLEISTTNAESKLWIYDKDNNTWRLF